jgi:hypothetical protein
MRVFGETAPLAMETQTSPSMATKMDKKIRANFISTVDPVQIIPKYDKLLDLNTADLS